MASLFSYFVTMAMTLVVIGIVKRLRNEITVKSEDIDGGTTKESPSKLKPIKKKAQASGNNNCKSVVGSEVYNVKQGNKRSANLKTDGVKYGGGKDSASDHDDECKGIDGGTTKSKGVITASGDGLILAERGTKDEWFKMQTFDQRGKGGGVVVGGSSGGGGGGVGGCGSNGGVTGGQQG